VTAIEKLIVAPKKIREAGEAAIEAVLRGEPEPLVTNQAKAARMLDCSRFTVLRLEKDGVLHPVMIRGMKRYRLAELHRLAGAGE